MPVPLVGNFVGLVAVERCRDAQVGLRVSDEFDVGYRQGTPQA